MTTSRPAGEPAGRHAADPVTSADPGLQTETGSPDGAPEVHAQTAPGADAQAAPGADAQAAASAGTETALADHDSPDAAGTGPPDDVQQLRQEIEQTRQEIGQTVEQLAAKADVKAQAKAKAADLKTRMKSKAAQARSKAPNVAASARGQIADKTAAARQKGAAVGGAAKTQVQARTAPIWDTAPEPLKRAVVAGAGTAKQRRVPLAVAAAVLVAGCLVLWRRRRR